MTPKKLAPSGALIALAVVAAGCGTTDRATEKAPPTIEATAPPPPAASVARAKPHPDHRHGVGSMKIAYKALDQYALDPNRKAECWWEHPDQRPQQHWRCQVGNHRYTIHVTPSSDPVNYVTDGWNFNANVKNSRHQLVSSSSTSTHSPGKICWPGVTIPATYIAAIHVAPIYVAAIHVAPIYVPATTFNGVHYPAHTYPGHDYPAHSYPGHDYPARTIPGSTVPGQCFDAATYPSPFQTSVRISGYGALDPSYSSTLSSPYWQSAGSVPDYTAPGFGELNGAGFPKNEYVRSYLRRDGTFVHSYWRNSSSDGLPTCRIIHCSR